MCVCVWAAPNAATNSKKKEEEKNKLTIFRSHRRCKMFLQWFRCCYCRRSHVKNIVGAWQERALASSAFSYANLVLCLLLPIPLSSVVRSLRAHRFRCRVDAVAHCQMLSSSCSFVPCRWRASFFSSYFVAFFWLTVHVVSVNSDWFMFSLELWENQWFFIGKCNLFSRHVCVSKVKMIVLNLLNRYTDQLIDWPLDTSIVGWMWQICILRRRTIVQ